MVILLRQAKERCDGEARPRRRRRYLDVGWAGRRYEACRLVLCRRTRWRCGDRVHGRFGEATRQPRSTDERRTPRLFGGRRGRIWRRRGLCSASETVWPYLGKRQGPV